MESECFFFLQIKPCIQHGQPNYYVSSSILLLQRNQKWWQLRLFNNITYPHAISSKWSTTANTNTALTSFSVIDHHVVQNRTDSKDLFANLDVTKAKAVVMLWAVAMQLYDRAIILSLARAKSLFGYRNRPVRPPEQSALLGYSRWPNRNWNRKSGLLVDTKSRWGGRTEQYDVQTSKILCSVRCSVYKITAWG